MPPILSPQKTAFSIIETPQYFSSQKINQNIEILTDGTLSLEVGDYIIPVMTYCMNSSAISPLAHNYTLSKLEGKRAKMIHDLNFKASKKFKVNEIQLISWAIQSGMSFEEMSSLDQELIKKIIPEHVYDLKNPIWKKALDHFNGPYSDEFSNFISYRNQLKEYGRNYEKFKEFISTPRELGVLSKTSWSRISENIDAKFETENAFNGIGFIKIRIHESEASRKINSDEHAKFNFDLYSLVANPNDKNVQPLTFSSFLYSNEIVMLPILLENPMAVALVTGMVIHSRNLNWDMLIELGDKALSEAHDELEKPLKEHKIVSGKGKTNPEGTRQYQKSGGEEQLEKDFEKIPGDIKIARDGIEYKEFPDRKKIIKRLEGKTLEVQSGRKGDHIKIKVRY